MEKLIDLFMPAAAWARKHLAPLAAALVILLGLVFAGMFLITHPGWTWPAWTGFGPTTGTDGTPQPGKTLWDWMQLLVIPLVLSLAAYFFNQQEKKSDERRADAQRQRDLEIAEYNKQEEILQGYLDKISGLILDRNLMEINKVAAEIYPENAREAGKRIDDLLSDQQRGARSIAQVWTITALRQLDNRRRNILCQFLRDANLKHFILESADLSGLNLTGTNLSSINFSHASFFSAQLNLANFSNASLICTSFAFAVIDGTNFKHANLFDANIENYQLKQVSALLTGATLPDGRIYDPNVNKEDFGGRKVILPADMKSILDGVTAMLSDKTG